MKIADQFADVCEFNNVMRVTQGKLPSIPPDEVIQLRLNLVVEEHRELIDAIKAGDLAEIADAGVDLIYVVNSVLVAYGIDPRPVWNAVHAANMAKVGGPRREDGKVLKPPGWTHPDIAAILAEQKPIPEIRDDGVPAPPSNIHPEADVSDLAFVHPTAKIGAGAFVQRGAMISRGVTIGCEAIIGRGVTVEADCVFGDHSVVQDGSRIGMGTVIGDRTLIDCGVTVMAYSVIGSNVEIQAGASLVARSVVADNTHLKAGTVSGMTREAVETLSKPSDLHGVYSDEHRIPPEPDYPSVVGNGRVTVPTLTGYPADHPSLVSVKDAYLVNRCGICGKPWGDHSGTCPGKRPTAIVLEAKS